MTFYKEIFILGAGASADYGLKCWDELADSLREELKNNKNPDEKEYVDITSELLSKVGEDKLYKTIDEAIRVGLRKGKNIIQKKDFIFKLICKCLKGFDINEKGFYTHWMEELFDIPKGFLEYKEVLIFFKNKCFINFNYDEILLKNLIAAMPKAESAIDNIVNDEYELKHGISRDKIPQILELLSGRNQKMIYQPHGSFRQLTVKEEGYKNLVDDSTYRIREPEEHKMTALSCYDSNDCRDEDNVFLRIQKGLSTFYGSEPKSTSYVPGYEINLFILGVGPKSLEYNIDKLKIVNGPSIENVYCTCFNSSDEDIYREYFEKKFTNRGGVHLYKDCNEIIKKYKDYELYRPGFRF